MNAPPGPHGRNSYLLTVAAIVLFVLAAIFFAWVHSITRDTDFALLAAGLAAFAAAHIPL